MSERDRADCRECAEGKCGACNGTALIDDGMDVVEVSRDFADLLSAPVKRPGHRSPRLSNDEPLSPLNASIAYGLYVECPVCHQPAGARCTRAGVTLHGLHGDRTEAARRAGFRSGD